MSACLDVKVMWLLQYIYSRKMPTHCSQDYCLKKHKIQLMFRKLSIMHHASHIPLGDIRDELQHMGNKQNCLDVMNTYIYILHVYGILKLRKLSSFDSCVMNELNNCHSSLLS